MIEHADAALESWLSTLDPPIEIVFGRPTATSGVDPEGESAAPVLTLVLTSVNEQSSKRDNQIDDVRSSDGRVVARQRSTRFFELDYVCSFQGPARDAHRALGDVVQLLVDHDVVPSTHVPDELAELGYPLDVRMVAPSSPVAAITMRLVLPVQPTADRDIGPPTTSLHLDMSPPPGERAPDAADADQGGVQDESDGAATVVGERKWTMVRRRELIGRPSRDGSPASKASTTGPA
jgi:hypothetical protein